MEGVYAVEDEAGFYPHKVPAPTEIEKDRESSNLPEDMFVLSNVTLNLPKKILPLIASSIRILARCVAAMPFAVCVLLFL